MSNTSEEDDQEQYCRSFNAKEWEPLTEWERMDEQYKSEMREEQAVSNPSEDIDKEQYRRSIDAKEFFHELTLQEWEHLTDEQYERFFSKEQETIMITNPSEGSDEEEHYRKLIDAKEYLHQLTDEEWKHLTEEQYERLVNKKECEEQTLSNPSEEDDKEQYRISIDAKEHFNQVTTEDEWERLTEWERMDQQYESKMREKQAVSNPSEEDEQYRASIDAKEHLHQVTTEEWKHMTLEQYQRFINKEFEEHAARSHDMDMNKDGLQMRIPRTWKRCFGWEDGNGEAGPGYVVVEDDVWFGEGEERKRKQYLIVQVLIPVYLYAKKNYPSESWISALDKSYDALEAVEIEKVKTAEKKGEIIDPVRICIPRTLKRKFGWKKGDGEGDERLIIVEDDEWFREDGARKQDLLRDLGIVEDDEWFRKAGGLQILPPVGSSTKSWSSSSTESWEHLGSSTKTELAKTELAKRLATLLKTKRHSRRKVL